MSELQLAGMFSDAGSVKVIALNSGGKKARLPAVLSKVRSMAKESQAGRMCVMIEELRVSLFAQKLGTPFPVSAKRIEKAIAAVRR